VSFINEETGVPKLKETIPNYVRLVVLVLGLMDIVRGIAHTVLIDHAARDIAGLAIDGPDGRDLLQLMTVFGISNLVSGAALLMAAAWDQRMAWLLTGIIPLAYAIGSISIRTTTQGLPESAASWGGKPIMHVYLGICLVTFFSGGLIAAWKSRQRA
jgi:hypothetical protein